MRRHARTIRATRAAFTCLLPLALLAACGGDDEGTSNTTAKPVGSATTGSTGATGANGGTATTAPAEGPGSDELPEGYEGYTSETYAQGAHWLCHPDDADENVCERDLDATIVNADGSTEVAPHEPASDPAIDCFYVYPTISSDESANSDLEPQEDAEIRGVLNQFARLNAVCRTFAPVYRQRTLGAMFAGEDDPATRDVAYDDVVDAWKHYVAHDNDGRGVLLVGHSQGAGLLGRLIQEEIDDEPLLRDRLVAAYLIGAGIGVPEGEDVGGDFANVPLCRAADQIGCVVTYASFRATAGPPANSFFGRPWRGPGTEPVEGLAAGCTNPAALGGGSGDLTPYFATDNAKPFGDAPPADAPEVTTAWVTMPGLVTSECVERDGFTFLEITVHADAGPRTDDIGGDLTPQWGLHLIDVNLAMGNLVELAGAQAAAYTAG